MFKNITKYIRGYSQKIRFFKKLKSNLTLYHFNILDTYIISFTKF